MKAIMRFNLHIRNIWLNLYQDANSNENPSEFIYHSNIQHHMNGVKTVVCPDVVQVEPCKSIKQSIAYHY